MRRFARTSSEAGQAKRCCLALQSEDITHAADLFRPIHERTNTVDGWVSLEVSPHMPTGELCRMDWVFRDFTVSWL
jgi:hypothetical protein